MNLIIYTLRTIAGAIVTPPLVFLLIALMVILYSKNKKTALMQKLIIGGSVDSAVELTLSQFVLGIIAGCIGSIILTSLGVVFNKDSGIIYLFLISILLMFIKPKFICFSYSGAILGGISLLINLFNKYSPKGLGIGILNIDILYLMTFIGILHIIEGMLVAIDGDRGAIPVFTNTGENILGGYALKRYWVIPVAIIIGLTMNDTATNLPVISIDLPKWWYSLKMPSTISLLETLVISIFPFYAVLGYSSVTFTKSKREKALSSGMHILVYGILLTIIAQLSRFGVFGQVVVLIMAPLGHEIMLKLQRKKEEKTQPKYISNDNGLVILEVASDSEFAKLGVHSGDRILTINDKKISSENEIYPILKENLYNIILTVEDIHGAIRNINFKYKKNKRLGLLLVPKDVKKEEVIPMKENNFQNILNKFKDNDNTGK